MANEFATYKGVTYANGKLPDRFKVRLEGNNLARPEDPAVLREDAGTAWNQGRAKVLAKTGIALAVRGWDRSIEDQEQFFHERYKAWAYSPFNDYRWHTHNGILAKYGRTNGAAAAIPGTSNHGLGLAVDVVDFGGVGDFNNPRRVASIGILKEYGWTETEGRGTVQEPWHLVYNHALNQHKNDIPPISEKEDDFMARLTDAEVEDLYTKVKDLHTMFAGLQVEMPWKDARGNKVKYTFRSALGWVSEQVYRMRSMLG